MVALTFISHSLSRTESGVCKMASVEGFAAALDTITSIFPYFCNKPKPECYNKSIEIVGKTEFNKRLHKLTNALKITK